MGARLLSASGPQRLARCAALEQRSAMRDAACSFSGFGLSGFRILALGLDLALVWLWIWLDSWFGLGLISVGFGLALA